MLRQTVLAATSSDLPALADELARNRVIPQGAKGLLVARTTDATTRSNIVTALVGTPQVAPSLVPTITQWSALSAAHRAGAAQLLASENVMLDGALPLVRAAALDTTMADDVRGKLLGLVSAMPGRVGLDAAAALFGQLTPTATSVATSTATARWKREHD